MERPVYISEFQTVEDAIRFAKTYWPNQDSDFIALMLEINTELDEDKTWLIVIGICDICGAEEITFVPTCIYENGIVGIECFNCGNMSIFPKEQEDDI